MSIGIADLRADIAAMLDVAPDELGDDDNLMDFGLDSMRAINLAMRWEEAGVPLDLSDFAEAPTLRELSALLEERQATEERRGSTP